MACHEKIPKYRNQQLKRPPCPPPLGGRTPTLTPLCSEQMGPGCPLSLLCVCQRRSPVVHWGLGSRTQPLQHMRSPTHTHTHWSPPEAECRGRPLGPWTETGRMGGCPSGPRPCQGGKSFLEAWHSPEGLSLRTAWTQACADMLGSFAGLCHLSHGPYSLAGGRL